MFNHYRNQHDPATVLNKSKPNVHIYYQCKWFLPCDTGEESTFSGVESIVEIVEQMNYSNDLRNHLYLISNRV